MTYLCYYELHVDARTFYVHIVVDAASADEATDKLESQHGDHYHLQAKGCLGLLTEELTKKYMSDRPRKGR